MQNLMLAVRIVVSNLHKNTKKLFSETIKDMYYHINERSGLKAPLIADDVYDIIMKNAARLVSEIIYDRDFDYDYFGLKTLERSYLLKVQGKVIERPQHMLMRVTVGIHKDDIDSALKTYHMMSQIWFTHASPALFNAGTARAQLSTCLLVCMEDDRIEGIYDSLKECAVIRKSAGGIGVSVHTFVQLAVIFVEQMGHLMALFQCSGCSMILSVMLIKEVAREREEHQARDLFYALWVPDLFMERVQSNGLWSLFCPNEAPGLADGLN
ncbi:hypothetical protein ACOSQ4_030580 [Xanthoceras sorbifolium]